jgi:hypothetical protein
MTTTSGEIQLKAFPRVNAGRAIIVAGLVVSTLAIGLVVGRITAPRTEPARASVSEQPISTAFLADSGASRIKVMEKMNQIAREASPFAASAETRLQVMRGMNRLSDDPS